MSELSNIDVLILGLGASGLAMARWCAGQGARVRVWDSRESPPQAAALAAEVAGSTLFSGELSAAALAGVARIYKSPGLSPRDDRLAPLLAAAREAGIAVRGELDLFVQALAALKAARGYAPQVIAITGTNGKTTTTALTAQLVERAGRRVGVAGNIGPTMLDTLAAAIAAQAAADAEAEAAAQAEQAGAPAQVPGNVTFGAAVGDSGLAAMLDADELQALAALDATLLADDVARDAGDEVADDAANESANDVANEVAAGALDDGAHADQAAVALIPPPAPAPVFSHLPEVWVLELSSFQLDGVQDFAPTAATVLNVTQDHLDWHGSMEAYAAAKARIFGNAGDAATVMVINRGDPAVEAMVPAPVAVKPTARGQRARTTARRVTRFGVDAPRAPGDFGLVEEMGMAWLVRAMAQDDTIKRKPGEVEELVIQRLMPADALRIRGRHNAANALAALALATAVGMPLAPMLHGLREYRGEPHRVEPIGRVGDIEFFDDSKGTNVGATVAAVSGLGADRAPARLVVILGGDGKGQDFKPLAEPLRRHARAAATIGKDAAALEAVLQSVGVRFERHASLEDATRWSLAQAAPTDAVLLSPACASLDMFRDYKHRAQVFADAVRALAQDGGEIVA